MNNFFYLSFYIIQSILTIYIIKDLIKEYRVKT